MSRSTTSPRAWRSPRLGGHKDIIQSLRFSPDGKRLAAGSYEFATVWDLPADPRDRPRAETFGPHAFRVLAIDFSPDGKLIATGGGEPSRSGEVKVWDVGDGQPRPVARHPALRHRLRPPVQPRRDEAGHARRPTSSSRSSGSSDGKELKSFEGHTHHVLAVDWKGDGKQLVTGGADNVLKVWDFETGEQLRTLQAAGKQVTAVRWVPGQADGGGGLGRQARPVLEPERRGQVVRTFTGPGDYVFGVAVSKDGKLVAAGGADGVLFLWNGETRR